jgi:hypothetical protein
MFTDQYILAFKVGLKPSLYPEFLGISISPLGLANPSIPRFSLQYHATGRSIQPYQGDNVDGSNL